MITTAEQDFPLDFLQDPRSRLQGVSQTCTARAGEAMSRGNPQNPERRVDQTTFPRARSSSPNYIRGHLFFSSHPPPRGALELELRRRRHTGGLQQSVDTITSQVSTPPSIHVRRSHWRYPRGEHSRQRDRPRRTANPFRSVLNNSQIM